jgi:predicted NBD/HSP70 family sugar kinase
MFSCMSDAASGTILHGVEDLPMVTVDAYNAELRDAGGFIGDRASSRAFRAMVDESRERIRGVADDPLGETATSDLSKKKMDKLLAEGDPEAAGVIHGAIESFAAELATVIARFLKLKSWSGTERIVVGGGLRRSRVGELAIGRTSVLLKSAGHAVELGPSHKDPDQTGLLGAINLAPAAILDGRGAVLAMDIGGSNIRAGLVALHSSKKGSDLRRGTVEELDLWRYADEEAKPTRDEAVDRIVAMLERLTRKADKTQLDLAAFVGIGCPGIISRDGQIERGGQNLPGNWESSRFNLPAQIRDRIPTIGGRETVVVMHNDAVVHGLGELGYVQDVKRWGMLTIGTGLGNARFTNKRSSATVGT